MRNVTMLVTTVVWLSVGTVVSAANLLYDSQGRSVCIFGIVLGEETYWWNECDEVLPEDNFDPFDAYLYDGTQIGELYAYSSASQSSVLGDTLITGLGDAWATRSSPACVASASSGLLVYFHVETESTIRLSGEVTADYEPEPIGEALVLLAEDEAVLFEAWAVEEDTDFAFVYTLMPGRSYLLIAYAEVDISDWWPEEPCESTGAFDVTLNAGEDQDCNDNGIHDWLDIFDGTSEDCNGNGIPDECVELENDCNDNAVPDECDVPPICDEGPPVCSLDCQPDLIPDECELEGNDCNGNGIPDECEVHPVPPSETEPAGPSSPAGAQPKTPAPEPPPTP